MNGMFIFTLNIFYQQAMAKLIIPLIFMAILGSMLSYVNGCGEVGSSGSEADLETVRIRLKGYFDSTLSSLDSKVKLVQFRVGKIRAGKKLTPFTEMCKMYSDSL